MAQVSTNVVIVASAQSVVTWGRTLTTEEISALRVKRGSMWSEGKFGSFPTGPTFTWVDTAAATEYVAYCNTFTPPPVSAVVQDIPEPTEA
jgi:hypothetical protein